MTRTNKIVTIVGCGPGGRDYLTPAAERAAREADIVFGARRLLDLFHNLSGEKIPVAPPLADILRRMVNLADAETHFAVLVSGDPGLHSLAQLVLQRLGRDNCRVIPGISSVQAAFAAIGVPWKNARVESAHREPPDHDPAPLAGEDKIAVLLGSDAALEWTARLARETPRHRCFVCENLTLPDERVREMSAGALQKESFSNRAVVLFVKEDLWK